MSQDRLSDDGITRIGGRNVRILVSNPVGDILRMIYFVDVDTHLVIRTELHRRGRGGKWIPNTIQETQFNQPLPTSTFDPKSFSRTARTVDRDRLEAVWKQRLMKPIVRQRLAGGTVELRDVERNADGDLFILYTQSNDVDVSIGWNASLTDGAGNRYLRRPLDIAEPDHGHISKYRDLEAELKGRDRSVLRVDGERLFGDLWIPILPPKGTLAQDYRMTFDPRPEPRRAPRLVKRLGSGPVTAGFSLKDIPRTGTGLLPEWAACMTGTMSPLIDLNLARSLERAHYFEEHNDTRHALIFNRLLIRRASEFRNRFGGLRDPGFDDQRMSEAVILANIGDESIALGQTAEARNAYKESLRLNPNRPGHEWVAAMLARLQ